MRHVANVATKGQTKVAGLEKQAERDKLARDFNLASFTPEPGMIYTRVRAISARVNRNFDGFESSELKRAYRSFEGRPVFVNHENADPTRTRGIVVASAYREDGDDRYIELLIEVDAQAFPKLAQEIADGNIDSVSMGCEVESTICSYCGNEADDLGEFCEHILNHKGQTLSRLADNGIVEDALVYEICRGVNFFEISFVFDPADETALAQNVIDSRTAMRKRSYGERVAPQPVDTLTDSGPCPQCGTEDYNGKQCRWCDYIAPPEEFQDPDTSKAKENDLRDNSGTFDHEQHHQEDKTMPRHNNLQAALRERRRERALEARRKNSGYTTRDEAIAREITEPLAEFAADFDIDAIADEYLQGGDGGYEPKPGADLWDIAQRHDKTARRRERARNARRKQAEFRWETDADGQQTAEIPGGAIIVFETDEDGWAYSVRSGGEFSNEPDVDYADGFSTADEACAAAEREWKGEGITARRKQAEYALFWEDYGNEERASITRGSFTTFYYLMKSHDGTFSLYVNESGNLGDDEHLGDFNTAEEAKNAADKHSGLNAASRKQAGVNWASTDEGTFAELLDGTTVDVLESADGTFSYNIYGPDGFGKGNQKGYPSEAEAKAAAEAKLTEIGVATARRKQASELEPDEIPSDFPVKPLATQAEIDSAGDPVQDGECGLWWDDAISTSYTPAPGGRCPFEAYHDYDSYYASRRKRAGASEEVSALGLKSADGLIGQDRSQYIDNQGRVLNLYLEGDAYAELVDAETNEVVVNFENSNEAVEALQGAGITARRRPTARRKRAGLDWFPYGRNERAELPGGYWYEISDAANQPGGPYTFFYGHDSESSGRVYGLGFATPEEAKAEVLLHMQDLGITAHRRKRADADTDAAQPDERVNLDEQGDVTNKNTDLQVAQPDEKKDVEKVDEHQPSNATDSQQDATTYENQGGAPAKASAIQAMALVDAYEEMGLIDGDARIAKFAEFEKTSATIVQDRLDLLARVKEAGATAPTRTAKRSTVPRSANRQRLNPSMGRVANSGADGQPSDYLMTL